MAGELPIEGQKLYQRRARTALPVLAGQAEAGEPVTYGDLAEEIGMSNPRNLNYVLGAVGETLVAVEERLGFDIPPVQGLVVNKHTQVPGRGIAEWEEFADFDILSPRAKCEAIRRAHSRIYAFERWEEVLEALGLPPPCRIHLSRELVSKAATGRYGRGKGEGEEHRRFKEHLAAHVGLLEIPGRVQEVQVEKPLPSGDRVDIFVRTTKVLAAVEVKAAVAPEAELLRGLFQCVKYRALMEAVATFDSTDHEPRALLALEADLPRSLIAARNRLGVRTLIKREWRDRQLR